MLHKSAHFIIKFRGSIAFFLVCSMWFIVANNEHLYMRTVINERANVDRSFWQANQGFSVQTGRLSLPVAQIIFWKSGALNAQLFLELQKITKIIEAKWLAEKTAVYLHLEVHDFEPRPGGEAKIIYDFDRGQLMVYSQARLWRSKLGLEKVHWATQEEFNAFYNFLTVEKPKLIIDMLKDLNRKGDF